MSYAKKFILAYGQECVIDRPVPFNTKVSIVRSTKAAKDLGARAGYWEGLIPLESQLKSGEIITVTNEFETIRFLVQNTNYDAQSRQIAFFCAKCNAIIQHKRYIQTIDENNNLIREWQDVNPEKIEIPCYSQAVTQKMKQEEVGLLDNTIYVFQVPKSLGVKELDRFVHNGKNYQVSSIDDVGLDGVWRVQVEQDNRPD